MWNIAKDPHSTIHFVRFPCSNHSMLPQSVQIFKEALNFFGKVPFEILLSNRFWLFAATAFSTWIQSDDRTTDCYKWGQYCLFIKLVEMVNELCHNHDGLWQTTVLINGKYEMCIFVGIANSRLPQTHKKNEENNSNLKKEKKHWK